MFFGVGDITDNKRDTTTTTHLLSIMSTTTTTTATAPATTKRPVGRPRKVIKTKVVDTYDKMNESTDERCSTTETETSADEEISADEVEETSADETTADEDETDTEEDGGIASLLEPYFDDTTPYTYVFNKSTRTGVGKKELTKLGATIGDVNRCKYKIDSRSMTLDARETKIMIAYNKDFGVSNERISFRVELDITGKMLRTIQREVLPDADRNPQSSNFTDKAIKDALTHYFYDKFTHLQSLELGKRFKVRKNKTTGEVMDKHTTIDVDRPYFEDNFLDGYLCGDGYEIMTKSQSLHELTLTTKKKTTGRKTKATKTGVLADIATLSAEERAELLASLSA